MYTYALPPYQFHMLYVCSAALLLGSSVLSTGLAQVGPR